MSGRTLAKVAVRKAEEFQPMDLVCGYDEVAPLISKLLETRNEADEAWLVAWGNLYRTQILYQRLGSEFRRGVEYTKQLSGS